MVKGRQPLQSSTSIVCSDSTSCTISVFASNDCTGAPKQTPLHWDTNGVCSTFVVPWINASVYGIFSQVTGATSAMAGLEKPIVGGYFSSDCSGDAVGFTSGAVCRGVRDKYSFQSQCSSTNTVEYCKWANSSTCSMSSPHQCGSDPKGYPGQPGKCTKTDAVRGPAGWSLSAKREMVFC